jgi:hypothetical protein
MILLSAALLQLSFRCVTHGIVQEFYRHCGGVITKHNNGRISCIVPQHDKEENYFNSSNNLNCV